MKRVSRFFRQTSATLAAHDQLVELSGRMLMWIVTVLLVAGVLWAIAKV